MPSHNCECWEPSSFSLSLICPTYEIVNRGQGWLKILSSNGQQFFHKRSLFSKIPVLVRLRRHVNSRALALYSASNKYISHSAHSLPALTPAGTFRKTKQVSKTIIFFFVKGISVGTKVQGSKVKVCGIEGERSPWQQRPPRFIIISWGKSRWNDVTDLVFTCSCGQSWQTDQAAHSRTTIISRSKKTNNTLYLVWYLPFIYNTSLTKQEIMWTISLLKQIFFISYCISTLLVCYSFFAATFYMNDGFMAVLKLNSKILPQIKISTFSINLCRLLGFFS